MKHNNIRFLKNSQYKDTKNLSARFVLYDFSYPKVDLYEKAIKALKLNGSEDVLEVGCGDGKVLVNLEESGHRGSLVGTDVSKGMFKDSKGFCKINNIPIKFFEYSSDKLPFKDGSFDVVLSFFMIYHMPDIERALREWRRVLKTNGRLLIAIGSENNLKNRRRLTMQIKEKAGCSKKRFIDSISFESAPSFLNKYFNIKKTKLIKYNLRIPEESLIIKAIESTKQFFEPKPKEEVWKSCMDNIKKQIQKQIKSKGYFHDVAERGFYICERK